MSIREMIRRAALEVGGLGVSTATRPDASPVEGTCPKSSCPARASGKTDQPAREGTARVIGWIALPQRVVQRGVPIHGRKSSVSATGSEPRPTTRKRPQANASTRGTGLPLPVPWKQPRRSAASGTAPPPVCRGLDHSRLLGHGQCPTTPSAAAQADRPTGSRASD